MRTKRLLGTLLLALLLPASGFGQAKNGPPTFVKDFVDWWNMTFGWHESIATLTCKDGFYFWVTYVVYNDGTTTDIPIKITPTGEPCECKPGGRAVGGSTPLGLGLRPREGNCTSEDYFGNELTIPNQSAPASMGSSAMSADEPLGYAVAGGPPLALLTPQPRAVSPPPFTYTSAFRYLPGGVPYNQVTTPIDWVCNSKLNPTMFRVDHLENVVTRYDMCTAKPITKITVRSNPLQVQVTPDGAQTIVTSFDGAITFIDNGTNAVTKVLETNPSLSPSGIAVSPDGTFALVTSYAVRPDAVLLRIDLADQSIDSTFTLDTDYPQSVFINPDGTLAWVTFPLNSVVEVIDILSGSLVQMYRNIFSPSSVVFNPTGTTAFVSSGNGSVAAIDTKTYSLIKTIPADLGATDLRITPDGSLIYVTNSDAKSITIINTKTLTSTTSSVAGTPQGAVLVPAQ